MRAPLLDLNEREKRLRLVRQRGFYTPARPLWNGEFATMTNIDNNRLKSSAEADEKQQRRLGREEVQRVQQRNSVVDFYHSVVGPAFSEIFEELKMRFGAKRQLSQESHDAPHWEDAYESLTVKTAEEEEFFYKIMVDMVGPTQTLPTVYDEPRPRVQYRYKDERGMPTNKVDSLKGGRDSEHISIAHLTKDDVKTHFYDKYEHALGIAKRRLN